MTRRALLQRVLSAALPGAAYPTVLEPRWLELTHTSIRLPNRQPSRPIKVLHLSDLHSSHLVPDSLIESAIQIGLHQQPDVACITGDFITNRVGFNTDTYPRLLSKLAQSVPTFAVLGNHDGGTWATRAHGFADHTVVEQILRASGITLLHNSSELLNFQGQDIQFVGVGDYWSKEIDAAAAFQNHKPGIPTVLLSHNPDSKTDLGGYPWDLMLCGHTHGGQVIIPFKGPKYAPVRDKRFVAGLKTWHDRQIYITRGVGNIGSVRFRCRPEVTILNI